MLKCTTQLIIIERNPLKDSKGTCYFLKSRLQTAVGTVNGKDVRVLRDTGCTGVVVRRDLVSDEQMLGKELDVTLINESKLKYPVACISVECPFFNGTTEALCMEDTLYDLVIGIIVWTKCTQSDGNFKRIMDRRSGR